MFCPPAGAKYPFFLRSSSWTTALTKKKNDYGHLVWYIMWYIKSTLYKRFLTWNKMFKKLNQLQAKLRSLWQAHFVVTILFVLALASDMAVLYENDTFSVFVLSTKKRYSSFSKKAFVFQKICSKVKVLKTFKIFTDCYIKTCRSLKRMAILKIPRTVF